MLIDLEDDHCINQQKWTITACMSLNTRRLNVTCWGKVQFLLLKLKKKKKKQYKSKSKNHGQSFKWRAVSVISLWFEWTREPGRSQTNWKRNCNETEGTFSADSQKSHLMLRIKVVYCWFVAFNLLVWFYLSSHSNFWYGIQGIYHCPLFFFLTTHQLVAWVAHNSI